MGAGVPKDQLDGGGALLEIDRAAPVPAADLVVAADLDAPRDGLKSRFYGFDLRGWAVGREHPIESVRVVHAAGRPLDAEVGGERSDVAALHPDLPWAATSEFFLPIGGLRLAPDFELSVEGLFASGARVPIATVAGRRARLSTSFAPRLEPIGLTTLGRTGSTAATRLIAAHPDVVAYRPFEFEPRVVTYWLDLLGDVADPASFRRQVTPSGPLSRGWWVRAGPPLPRRLKDDDLQALLGGENVAALAELCQSRIDRFYSEVAERFERPGARFFVEKLGPTTGALASELYRGLREVFLVRDFRDMIASTFAFNDKRGFQGFGRKLAASDSDYVRTVVAESVGELLDAWRARGGRAFLLRYEDLVSRPMETVRALFEHLGLDAGRERVEAAVATLDEPGSEAHRTSGAQASIGRWKRDLAADVRESCEVTLGPALREFGYA